MSKLPINQYVIEAFKRNKCKQVHQNVSKLAEELIRRCWKEDVFIVFTDGLRTMEEQATIYGKGRANYVYKGKQYGNPKAKKVSNALPGTSFHNYGLALDFVTCDGYGRNIDWIVGPKWRRAAAIAKELGFTWGGDWSSFKDYPHIQYDGGLTIKQVSAGQMPIFKSVPSIIYEQGDLTVSQYNELKKLVEAQQKEINALKQEKANIRGENVSPSHKDAWVWAKEKGLLSGDNPAGALSRQQAATVFQRFYELK
ncbi:M15 family metallopeptidase [Lederbergia citrisecunda]|uniref:M15 family metallopeptidase n=1 Tax=Lederbergia citrisecunda TaxID=2833583 RepID=UPI003D2D5D86